MSLAIAAAAAAGGELSDLQPPQPQRQQPPGLVPREQRGGKRRPAVTNG